MNVGIMSMQRIINYGSFLQAYGLKKTLESMGHEVSFVDYHVGQPVVENNVEKNTDNKVTRIFRVLFDAKYRKKRNSDIRQNKAFGLYYDQFQRSWLPILGITEQRSYNATVDVLVIGSDEVFNCTQSNENVGYSPELFGADNKAKKVITYAASFGSTTLKKLKSLGKDKEIASYLKQIDAISVRDNNSKFIVEELIKLNPSKNIDPVLVFDFQDETKDRFVDLKDYIIVYAYSGRISEEEAESIQKYAHKYGKKTLSIGVMQAFTDEYRCVDPFTMLAYFKNADYVVTDTFHGTVFSIKYQIPFAALIRNSNSEKVSDLLKTFQLESRAVEDVSDLERVLKTDIDKELLLKSIKDLQHDALRYLVSNLA